MSSVGFAIAGAISGNPVEADASGNLQVTLPSNQAQSGFTQLTSTDNNVDYNKVRVTEENRLVVAQGYTLASYVFNGQTTTATHKLVVAATTMTRAQSNGFLALNSGAITTLSTGISLVSSRVFNLDQAAPLVLRVTIKTINAAVTNKQIDLGFGFYSPSAGQGGAMNEFIGFRWTTSNGFQAVVETSQGGAPVSQTVNINAGVPLSDAITREYRIIITEDRAIFAIADATVATIYRQNGSWSLLKGNGLPFIARVFNAASAPASAPQLFIGAIDVQRYQGDIPAAPFLAALQGKGSTHYQYDVEAGSITATHNFPASGTAPGSGTGTNSASALNNTLQLGGYYRNIMTGVTATAHTMIFISGFINPGFPVAAGVASNARNFIVTGISISPLIVTTALTGGGFTALWFATVGATALASNTSDADGTTLVANKAHRMVPLNLCSTLTANAAVGTVSTDVGDHQFVFPTPLVVHPGELLTVGLRTIVATAAITAGVCDGSIYVNGYWE